MTHGWPGSVVEFLKVIGPLVDPAAHGGDPADAFHLVCPTLPGYGFSDKPEAPGWGVEKIGAAWGQLMARLGYEQYVAQGGDWGAIVTMMTAAQDPDHCQAFHLNMVVAPPDPDTMDSLTEREQSAMAGMQHYQDYDSGYSKQQSTRPQTLGYGLADSATGQAAWILEKFWAWTDCRRPSRKRAHPRRDARRRDDVLDHQQRGIVCPAYIGKVSAALVAAIRSQPRWGGSLFPKEIFRSSKRWAEKRFSNIIHWNELDKGGHFAAFEQPEVFVDEVRACFRHVR